MWRRTPEKGKRVSYASSRTCLLWPILRTVRDLHKGKALQAAAIMAAGEQKLVMVMKARVAFLGLLMCTAALPVGAGENDRMTLRVSPAVAFAPANLVVRATIPANESNRAVEIVAESETFYRSSEIQLEGDHAPRTSMFEFRSLPPGTYEVRATLRGNNGEQRSTLRQQVNVMASGAGH